MFGSRKANIKNYEEKSWASDKKYYLMKTNGVSVAK